MAALAASSASSRRRGRGYRLGWGGAGQLACQGTTQCNWCKKASCSGRKKGVVADEWLGHSRGGRTSKLHACADGKARPLGVVVSAGQCNDAAWLESVLDAIRVPRLGVGRPRKRPAKLRVDRAYSFNKQRKVLRRRGIILVSPEREDAKASRLAKGAKGGRPPSFDKQAYKGRNVVERCINRLKDFRAVATRYDKRGRNYLAGVLVASIVLWL
jgi:transposase